MGADQDDERARLLTRQRRLLRKTRWVGLILGALLISALGLTRLAGGASGLSSTQYPHISSARNGSANEAAIDYDSLAQQVNPEQGYTLPASYGNLGPQLLAAGVIDYETFASIYEAGGNPLTPEQIKILKQGSEEPIVIDQENASFLLNLFWAVGLANRNKILTEGPMVTYGDGKVENFASTAGWTLAAKPLTELYSRLDLIPLTPEQQSRVEEAASAIYRPCCDNPTIFPDCNHGMAMLGFLELMASQGASMDQMFEAAKYINAFWFPQQNLESAVYLKATKGIDFAQADARLVVGREYASGSGSAGVHQALAQSGLAPQAPGQQNSCSN